MRRPGRAGAAVVILLMLRVPASSAHSQAAPVRPLGAFDSRIVDFARQGAMLRLRSPECQRVLTDFRDPSGHTLIENLAPFAVPADEYLAQIPFLDGQGHRLCAAGQSQLLTVRGVPRVFVCKAFVQTVGQQRDQAEVYVIHEMLHTLGLAENPPSSQEITQQVKRRCLS